MEKANIDIRKEAKAANIPLWRIGEALAISENTIIRKMRHELPQKDKERIHAIITELRGSGGESNAADAND